MKGIATLAVAAGTFIILAVVAWRNGRTYCNTICPVGDGIGTLLAFFTAGSGLDILQMQRAAACARATAKRRVSTRKRTAST